MTSSLFRGLVMFKNTHMRSFIFTGLAINEGQKIVGPNILVTVDYVTATNLIVYVAGGHTADASTMSEIVDQDGVQVTRLDLTGTGSAKLSIAGLTPGTYIAIKTVSGTGAATATLQTGI